MSGCTVAECGATVIAKGLCWNHYQRQRRGSPLAFVRLVDPPEGKKYRRAVVYGCRRPTNKEKRHALFQWWLGGEKVSVEPNTGCWLWLGEVNPATGYGRLGHGRDPWGGYAHRAVIYFSGVDLPKGRAFHVRHSCDQPSCVNPAHLKLGTAADNVADRDAKGRAFHQRPEFQQHIEKLRRPRDKRDICKRQHGCGYSVSPNGHRYCRECCRVSYALRKAAALPQNDPQKRTA